MPSKSISQQRLMGMAYAYDKGDLSLRGMPSSLQEKIRDIVKSMKKKDLSDFAHTTHEGLPKKVTFIIDQILKEAGIKKALNLELNLKNEAKSAIEKNPELKDQIEKVVSSAQAKIINGGSERNEIEKAFTKINELVKVGSKTAGGVKRMLEDVQEKMVKELEKDSEYRKKEDLDEMVMEWLMDQRLSPEEFKNIKLLVYDFKGKNVLQNPFRSVD